MQKLDQVQPDIAGRDAEHNMHLNILMKRLIVNIKRDHFDIEKLTDRRLGTNQSGKAIIANGPCIVVDMFAMGNNFKICFIGEQFVEGISYKIRNKDMNVRGLATKKDDVHTIYCFIHHDKEVLDKTTGMNKSEIINYIQNTTTVRHEMAHILDWFSGKKMSVRYAKDYLNNRSELEAIFHENVPYFVSFCKMALFNVEHKSIQWRLLQEPKRIIDVFFTFIKKHQPYFTLNRLNAASRKSLENRFIDILPYAVMNGLKALRLYIMTLPKNDQMRISYFSYMNSSPIKDVVAEYKNKYKNNYQGKLFPKRSFRNLDDEDHYPNLDWSKKHDKAATAMERFAPDANPIEEPDIESGIDDSKSTVRRDTSDFFNRLLVIMAQNRYARTLPDIFIYNVRLVEFRPRFKATGDIKAFMPTITLMMDDSLLFVYEVFINNDRLTPFAYGIPDEFQVNSPFEHDGELTLTKTVQYEQGLQKAIREIRLALIEGRRQSRLFRKPKLISDI